MNQSDLFIQTPKSLEGVIDSVEGMDYPEPFKSRVSRCVEEVCIDYHIYKDYKRELENRWGESKQIMRELSLKYFNTPHKVDYIWDVIYRKYK